MEHASIIQQRLIAQAEQVKIIVAQGHYQVGSRRVDISADLANALAQVRLIRPADWDAIVPSASERCTGQMPAAVAVTGESTLQALERLSRDGEADLAALNFASARRPGGGWDTGARAQEESLGRASALVATLDRAPDYYAENRACTHLFYTDHAIWSPAVPCVARDDGTLLEQPYRAGFITMPAPNLGAMHPSESDLLALPGLWRRRISAVLALAIDRGVRRLVLGAWGCGAFGNDPILVARWFREVLLDGGWLHGFDHITFAIHDSARGKPCLRAFQQAFTAVDLP
jgi:uncharacterized protein (TIGR02452 family)